MDFGVDKEKLQLYYILAGLHYNIKVDYASLFWDEFTTYINYSKKATKIASTKFWSLFLNDVYQHDGILVPTDVEVDEYSTLQIPKTMVDNPIDFPSIWRIHKAILILVLMSNPMLILY